ncbi:thioredoxin-like domain-containing protein [Gautieria morchelliformis]|nr:thioredoxin-like domain-containing protein [Gautieria morchelliformis]
MRVSPWVPSLVSLSLWTGSVLAADGSNVIDLDSSNFESIVKPEPLILVEFFAPWCGHCKALAPHYEEAATALKEKNIPLAKVDCVDQSELCQQHGVQGYPTVKVFRNGTPADYPGPRKADGIISYMVKQSLPAVTEVNAANYEEFKQADRVVAIAYVTETSGAPAPSFSAAAEKHRDDYLFGLSTDPKVIADAGVSPPALVLYRKFDDPKVEYPTSLVASLTVEDIETFIKDNSMPLVDEVGADNYQFYAESGLPLAYLFLDPATNNPEEHVANLRPLAKAHKGKLNFVWIDATKFSEHAKALNIQEPKWPAFVIQDLSQQLKYPLEQNEDVTASRVAAWVQRYLAGDLKPQLKSQSVPESQDESVFTLVSNQFDDVVFNDDKDVFVEFYAPWCGHCKRLKPIWDTLGDRYAAIKDRITIAKMDATENDVPPSAPFRVSGFPTLKFKPAGSREFVDYDGDRSLESLIEFVEKQAKNPLDPQTPFKGKSTSTKVAATEAAAPTELEHDEL